MEAKNVKNIIANIYRLLEQKKLNKKGNIEYDSENGKILSKQLVLSQSAQLYLFRKYVPISLRVILNESNLVRH